MEMLLQAVTELRVLQLMRALALAMLVLLLTTEPLLLQPLTVRALQALRLPLRLTAQLRRRRLLKELRRQREEMVQVALAEMPGPLPLLQQLVTRVPTTSSSGLPPR